MTTTERLRERLLGETPSPSAVVWGWFGPLFLTVLGGLVRFWDLGRPHQLVFDETYYVKEGHSMMLYGYERRVRPGLDKQTDQLFTADTPNVWGNQPDMVVHPPVGKWMIGLGEWPFGYTDSFGWRFSAAVVGTLSILLVGRCAWYIFRSPVIATIAAFLLAVEGHQLVHSRTGLLDIFVSFFALLTFFFVLADREQSREMLARKVGTLLDDGADLARMMRRGPFLGARPYLWLAGISGGLCAGTKWSGAFFIAAFGLMIVFWGIGARRAAGVKNWLTGTAVMDGLFAFVALVVTSLVTYIASWAGWFAAKNSYNRTWAADNPGQGEPWMGNDLNSLWMYHVQAMKFHVRLTSPHSWQSNPWSWMVQARPTLFFAEYPTKGKDGCEVDECAKVINNVGTVSIWWLATAAVFVLLFCWLLRRDWRAGAILGGWAAGYLPWFNYQHRTIFTFYAVAFEPWVVLMAAYVLSLVLGTRRASADRRAIGWLVTGVYLLLTLLNFIYFWPVWTGQVLPKAGAVGFPGGGAGGAAATFVFIVVPVLALLLGLLPYLVERGLLSSFTSEGTRVAGSRSLAFAGTSLLYVVMAAAWAWACWQVVMHGSWESRMWWRSWT